MIQYFRIILRAFFLIALSGSSLSLAANYTYKAFDPLVGTGNRSTRINSIDDQGNILLSGEWHERDPNGGTNIRLRMFLYDARTTKVNPVLLPGSERVTTIGMNKKGGLFGSYMHGDRIHGFFLDTDKLVTIDYPDMKDLPSTPDPWVSHQTHIMYANDSDSLFGAYVDNTKVTFFMKTGDDFEVFKLPNLADLNAEQNFPPRLISMNARGDIVGVFRQTDRHFLGIPGPPEGSHWSTFLVTKDGVESIEFPGQSETEAAGINDRRQVYGSAHGHQKTHGFIWDEGGFIQIDYPGADSTTVDAMNNNGVIVGTYLDILPPGQFVQGTHVFIGTPSH